MRERILIVLNNIFIFFVPLFYNRPHSRHMLPNAILRILKLDKKMEVILFKTSLEYLNSHWTFHLYLYALGTCILIRSSWNNVCNKLCTVCTEF